MFMIINTKKKDVVWNYLGIIISLGSQIILLPILVKCLEPYILGLWYIFVSIGSIVILFDFGFTPTIARTVAYCWSGALELNKTGVKSINKRNETNYELLYFVIKTCKLVYFLIAILALLLMLTLGTWYIKNISNNMFTMEIFISWIIYAISIFFNLYIGYYSVALIGIGDISRQSRANIISKLLFLFIGTIGLIFSESILSLSIANLISGFAMRFLSAYFFYNIHDMKNLFKKIVFSNRYSIKYVLNNMWHNAWRDGFVSVTMYLTSQANTLLCASFLSLTETGIYSFCLQIVTAIANVSSGLYNSYMPALQSAYINKDKELPKRLYSTAVFLFYFIFILASIVFVFIGIPIIYYIKETFEIDRLLFVLLAINMLFLQRHRISASFIANMNRLPYVKSFIFWGIVSLIVSYIFMKYFNWGIYALIILPLIVQSLYNNWKWNTVVNNYLNMNELNLLIYGYQEFKYKFIIKKYK